MHRICVAPGILSATSLTLPTAAAHYVTTVLRLRPGDEIGVFDGTGRECCVRLTNVSSRGVHGDVVAVVPPQPTLTPLVLGQALPKHPKMDFIVEKCSELGLTTLVPLQTERTVVRHIAERIDDKMARWQRIAEAAARQCGRQTVLHIQPAMLLAQFCARYVTAPVKMLCWEEEQHHGIPHALAAPAGQSPIVIIIGPEGGFAPQEIALARAHNFLMVNLGPLILRTETAAIAVLSIVRYSLHELEPRGTCQ